MIHVFIGQLCEARNFWG